MNRRGISDCPKSLAEFCARRRKNDLDHFLRRRVRRRKYSSVRKLSETPRAQAPRSALGSVELMQSEASKWNLCARGTQIMRAAGCKPFQTKTQRSGFRLRACQKYFFDTLNPPAVQKEPPGDLWSCCFQSVCSVRSMMSSCVFLESTLKKALYPATRTIRSL